METKILSASKENIKIALDLLKKGEVLAVPTETVYGLVADAFCKEAVEKIFHIKKRPKNKPLSCNVSDFKMLFKLTCCESSTFKKLIENFWPGPLTVVVEKKEDVLDVVTAKKNSVAIRCSSNFFLKTLTEMFKSPLVVPSANISGEMFKTTAFDVYEELKGKVKLVFDGGKTNFGIESTIVSVFGQDLKILRHGAIKEQEILRILK